MKLIIASNNAHKIKEIKSILGGRFEQILGLDEAGIVCEPEETGKTFYENALIKARAIAALTRCAVLADDTGLCVDALGGAPGVNSARYASDHDNAANRKKLLQKLEGKANRSAHFESVVVLINNGKEFSASGKAEGCILESEQGSNGFGYDSLFYSTELNKTFGQASDEEKNSVSHRARALCALIKVLDTEADN